MEYLGWLFLGVLLGSGLAYWVLQRQDNSPIVKRRTNKGVSAAKVLAQHFEASSADQLTISERVFPYRMRADLQLALNRLFADEIRTQRFSGVGKEYSRGEVSLSECLTGGERQPTLCAPPQFEEIDIGEDSPVQALKNGLWLLQSGSTRCAALLSPAAVYSDSPSVKIEIAVPGSKEGTRIRDLIFNELEQATSRATCYRGKILSLEEPDRYKGESAGITVHELRPVSREQVILPNRTIAQLETNVITFIEHRPKLSALGMTTKKGLLFYGPPGTGKTHTIHYLAKSLHDHTTFLVLAEQIGLLGEYMVLAKLLQPSIVVIEDVDLIGKDRDKMSSPCEEVLLNKLLNEMDGLREQADILFILTTNRPEQLEAALAARPGRIDQAIEFPLPDEDGRRKLAQLYAARLSVSEEIYSEIVSRTDGVSAAFIKELMRRSAQQAIARGSSDHLAMEDIERTLDEMLHRGSPITLKLLGVHEGRYDTREYPESAI